MENENKMVYLQIIANIDRQINLKCYKMKYNRETNLFESPYWHPAVTADAVVFGYDMETTSLYVLMIKRGKAKENETPAFEDYWALPGGFITEHDDNMEKCVKRVLMSEAYVELFDNENGIEPEFMEQLHVFSSKERDPREFVITVAYYALVKKSMYNIQSGEGTVEAQWFPVKQLPEKIAFDHAEIIKAAIDSLKTKVKNSPIGLHLIDEPFTLTQLKALYEAILDKPLDRGNFRKEMVDPNDGSNGEQRRNTRKKYYIIPTGEKDWGHQHRSADYYIFNKEVYKNETE